MMQVKLRDNKGNEILFSPFRDLAYFWPYLVAASATGFKYQILDDVLHNILEQYSKIKNYDLSSIKGQTVIEADCLLGIVSLCRFAERAMDPTVTDPYKALEISGWFSLPLEIRNAVLYRMGATMLGLWFEAIRSSTGLSDVPENVQQLIQAGIKLAESLGVDWKSTSKATNTEFNAESTSVSFTSTT